MVFDTELIRKNETVKDVMLNRSNSWVKRAAEPIRTLIELEARRNFAANHPAITGLVSGNPKMKKDRPTTERLLAQFEGLHLLMEQTPAWIKLRLIGELNPLQIQILALLNISPTIYNLSSPKEEFKNSS